MASELLTMERAGAAALAAELRALVPAAHSVAPAVQEIIEQVRTSGDEALRELTRRFDGAESQPGGYRVPAAELERARQALHPPLRAGLEAALENVLAVQSAGLGRARIEVSTGTVDAVLREEPVQRAAVYVPGGRAPYPSTVVMGVATARAAGVGEIVVCSPPGANDGVVLGACALAGVEEVYRLGGAQAIAALAYGTETVRAVEVVVGPGNLYVQEAKRQLSGTVGIDGFAGPSDLMAIVEQDDGELDVLALDLLAQAEHGPGTLVVGVSSSEAILGELEGRIAGAAQTGSVIRLVRVPSTEEALELVQAFAPEHLQLAGTAAEALAPRVTHAGCVFVGSSSGTAFGDYIAGSNHVLPTAGTATFASALSPQHFRRRFTEVRVLDATVLACAAAPVARAEGFELHARSMEARIRDNR